MINEAFLKHLVKTSINKCMYEPAYHKLAIGVVHYKKCLSYHQIKSGYGPAGKCIILKLFLLR